MFIVVYICFVIANYYLSYKKARRRHSVQIGDCKATALRIHTIPILSLKIDPPIETPAAIPNALIAEAPSWVAPHSTLCHQNNKLFWRINRTIGFRVYVGDNGAVVIRSFDRIDSKEFPVIILDSSLILAQARMIKIIKNNKKKN